MINSKDILYKSIFLIIVLILSVSLECFAQTTFNKIVDLDRADTHILVSTTPTDFGYIIVCGTGNYELFEDRRCSLIAILDNIGNCTNKTFVGDSIADTYEGWFHQKTFITDSNTYKYVFNKKFVGACMYEFDSNLDIISSKTYYFSNDSTLKDAGFLSFSMIDNYMYIPIGEKINSLEQEYYRPVLWKYDCQNNLIYKKNIDTDVVDHTYNNIIKSHDNNLIAFGSISNKYLWIATKIDTSGNIIWTRQYGRNTMKNGADTRYIYSSPDSCYVMSGIYPVCYADRFEYRTNDAACIRKINDNGNLLWEKAIKNYYSDYYNGPGILDLDCSYDLYVDNDGYIYIAGQGTNLSTGMAGFLTKLTPDGNIMYRRYYTPDGSKNGPQLYLNSVKPTPDGGFIMGGYTYDRYYTAADFGDYYQQPWLVKTDMDGLDGLCYTELPELTLDVFIPDTVCNLDTIDCVVNISGPSAPYTLEFSTGQTIENIYYPDIFVPKEIGIDTILSGELMYQYSEPVTEATLKDTTVENVIARHYNIRTPRDSGEQQLTITLTDFYGNTKTITKDLYVNHCNDLVVDENENIVLSIYPNPATECINIAGENIASIEICNLLGGVVYEAQNCSSHNVISTENMPAGSYYVRVRLEDGKVITKKIIIL